MRRSVVTAFVVAAGSAAAAVVWRRRSHRERVDLYFEDGSMVSLGEGEEGGERLLPLAREVLSSARG